MGVLGLLLLQFPNGESSTSTGDQADILSNWTGHSGMSLVAASWTLGAFACVFVVARLPRRAPGQAAGDERAEGKRDGAR